MDKKSKILLWILILSIIISIGYTFYKTIIKGDFEVIESEEEELVEGEDMVEAGEENKEVEMGIDGGSEEAINMSETDQ